MNADSRRFAREFKLGDLAATEALGARIAAGLKTGVCVALAGELGAGKTTLARAILRALGIVEAVPSPTFTLVQSYETSRIVVRHYDLYRIERAGEMAELGLDEALDEGAVLIEWPERAGDVLPQDTLHVRLVQNGAERHAAICGPAEWTAYFEELHLVR